VRYDDKRRKFVLDGKSGFVYVDEIYLYVFTVFAKSKRHLGSVKKQLSFTTFMSFIEQDGTIEASFRLDRLPTSEEAITIRKLLGLKRRPTLSEGHREALKNHAISNLEGIRARNTKSALATT
jgi:hypothetical protein